ncbi:retrovirus-related pol polyprotein from transposon TNT 1-94 [Tanacetum coccineum]
MKDLQCLKKGIIFHRKVNSEVDACKNAKEMWERIKRLMHGSEITTHVRHSRLMDEFDKFAAKEGESLDSVHERLTTLVNIMDRYGGNANKNAGRNRTQGFNAGDESNQIISSVFHELSLLQEKRMFSVTITMRNTFAMELKQPSTMKRNDFMIDTILHNGDRAISQIHASSKVHEQVSHGKRKNDYQTMIDDQIDSNIIFDDPFVENNGGTSKHDSTAHDEYREIQMLAYNVQREAKNKKPGLGYTNPERLKKAIVAQPKMYDGDLLHEHKIVQIVYEKLNALYETFVPQQELSAEQIYFLIPSTSDTGSKSKDVPSESPGPNMPTESRSLYKTLSEIKEELFEEVQEMLNIFVIMEQKDNEKSPTKILLQNEIDRLLEVSLTSEIQDCVLLSVEQQKYELLKVELENSSSDSRDIQANLLKRIKILKNDFQRSQAQSIAFEFKLQHQKEKMAGDVSWKAKLSTLHDENVLLKHQVKSTVKERENIKLEFQRLFNSVKATRAQHQNEINEMIENVNQKTYDYADVCAQNQDLLMTISKLKSKLRTIDKGKNVNTKFDKSETLGQILCVTPFNKNLAIKDKNVSNANVIQLVLWIVDSGCSKHMTGNLQLLRNFVEKFMGIVRFGNDHFTAIIGYGDYVQGNITICHVYYVEGLGHNLFSVGQFCDKDLEVAFRSNTCYVRNLEGDDLLTGSQDSNLYTISISEMAASSPVYFLCTKDEASDMIIDFVNQVQRNLKASILTIRTDNGTEFKNEKLRVFYAKLGIVHKTLIARTPQQNGVVERRNRTLIKAARTMLIFSKAPEFLWAEAIATACFT